MEIGAGKGDRDRDRDRDNSMNIMGSLVSPNSTIKAAWDNDNDDEKIELASEIESPNTVRQKSHPTENATVVFYPDEVEMHGLFVSPSARNSAVTNQQTHTHMGPAIMQEKDERDIYGTDESDKGNMKMCVYCLFFLFFFLFYFCICIWEKCENMKKNKK